MFSFLTARSLTDLDYDLSFSALTLLVTLVLSTVAGFRLLSLRLRFVSAIFAWLPLAMMYPILLRTSPVTVFIHLNDRLGTLNHHGLFWLHIFDMPVVGIAYGSLFVSPWILFQLGREYLVWRRLPAFALAASVPAHI
jgi:hypothetical protein